MTEQIKQPAAADPKGAGLTGEKLEQADETTDVGQTGTNSGGSADGSGTASTDGAGLT